MISSDSDIGGRLPRGPHLLAPEEIAADQRRRLIDAMLQLISIDGYLTTSVAELIDQAGISRRTFYELYANREELLKGTFEAAGQATLREVTLASERSGGPTRQLEALMRRLCREADERPGMMALCAVEITAAGPSGYELREALVGDYAELIQKCLGANEEHSIPRGLASTLVGAVQREIAAHVRAGRIAELPALAPQLARWMRSYHPVPQTLSLEEASGQPSPSHGLDGLVGGRAPGTLTLAPEGYVAQVGRPSPSFLAHANRERLLDAVAQLNAKLGYSGLTVEAIAAQADLPERAFRASFKSKDECFATAMELGHTKGQAIVERARDGARDWREGVRNAVVALLEFLASEPCFTRLAFLDAPLAGRVTARRSNEHMAAYAQLMLDGAPQRRSPPPAAPATIVQGLAELAYGHIAHGRVAELPRAAPQAAYLALAPFLGVTEAAEVASGA